MKKHFLLFSFFITFVSLFFINFASAESVKNYIKQNANTQEDEERRLFPFVYFDFKSELFYDQLKVKDGDSKKMLYTKTELLVDLNLNQFFAFHTDFAIEKIKGFYYTPSSFNSFEKDESLFYGSSLTTKELTALFNFSRVKINVGKFSSFFSAGSERWNDYFYDMWYGTGGTFLNEGYALEEKLGLKIDALIIDNSRSKINIQGSVFTNDSTDLFKKPLFVEREMEGFTVPSGSKRMAGSSKALKSHSLSLQGFTGLYNRDTISFSLGYRQQASQIDVSEKGISGSLQYTITFFDDLTLTSFSEKVRILNAYAIDNFDETYLTSALSAGFSGLRAGFVRNHYKSKFEGNVNSFKFSEYFIGFEVPKTELGFFLARKEYDGNSDLSGFSINIRYRIR